MYRADAYWRDHFFGFFLAVLAASLKSAAVGAALEPTLFIFSPLPAAILALLALMLAYKPGLVFIAAPKFVFINTMITAPIIYKYNWITTHCWGMTAASS
jgi:hypothetical protein